jgi:hypothetical protein
VTDGPSHQTVVQPTPDATKPRRQGENTSALPLATYGLTAGALAFVGGEIVSQRLGTSSLALRILVLAAVGLGISTLAGALWDPIIRHRRRTAHRRNLSP